MRDYQLLISVNPFRLDRTRLLVKLAIVIGTLFGSVALFAAPKQEIETPQWTGGAAMTTDDGYADLVWEMPPGEYVPLFRVSETRAGHPKSEFFVQEPHALVYRLEPDQYEFKVQACIKK